MNYIDIGLITTLGNSSTRYLPGSPIYIKSEAHAEMSETRKVPAQALVARFSPGSWYLIVGWGPMGVWPDILLQEYDDPHEKFVIANSLSVRVARGSAQTYLSKPLMNELQSEFGSFLDENQAAWLGRALSPGPTPSSIRIFEDGSHLWYINL